MILYGRLLAETIRNKNICKNSVNFYSSRIYLVLLHTIDEEFVLGMTLNLSPQ